MIKAAEITFGVEIECNIPVEYADAFPVGGYHRGIQSPVLPSGWNTQRDGSVGADSGFFSCEIVSPKLVGEAGLVQVVQVIDLLDEIGARVNRTCGLHVHVGVQGMNYLQVQRVTKLFKAFEMAFYALNGSTYPDRYNNHYCANHHSWTGNRYQSLNLTNVSNGHIEIRVWSGTITGEVVVAAITMAVALVSRATNEAKIKTSDLSESKPVHMMASYARQFVTGDHMILPDLTPADIMGTMMAQAQAAKRVMPH